MTDTDKELSGEELKQAIIAFVNEAKDLAVLIEKMKGAGDNAAVALDHKVKRIQGQAPKILRGLAASERI